VGPDVTITKGGGELADRLEGLWLELFAHHAAVAPHLGPFVTTQQSWAARRRRYDALLATPDAFVLLAEQRGAPVGYALVHLREEDDDTWLTGDRVAEVETLVVAARSRGDGIGTALLDRVDIELERLGVDDLVLVVLPTNTSAVAFYEARGFEPQMLHLWRPPASGRRGTRVT
jgi:ribosomal protein S18 acetylase RimI-like enzyme